MHKHFDQHLNLKEWITTYRPRSIVECGAGTGELTTKLASLIDEVKFTLTVISDRTVPGLDSRIEWRHGISYKVLPTFKDSSIDLCIIDTDHNYWTLLQELMAVQSKITEGGVIALHDVDTFYHATGMAMSYGTLDIYPTQEIEKLASQGGIGDALIDFLHFRRNSFRLVSFTSQSNGAALVRKETSTHYPVLIPGEKPAYAEKK